jgi:hypothetical protein
VSLTHIKNNKRTCLPFRYDKASEDLELYMISILEEARFKLDKSDFASRDFLFSGCKGQITLFLKFSGNNLRVIFLTKYDNIRFTENYSIKPLQNLGDIGNKIYDKIREIWNKLVH